MFECCTCSMSKSLAKNKTTAEAAIFFEFVTLFLECLPHVTFKILDCTNVMNKHNKPQPSTFPGTKMQSERKNASVFSGHLLKTYRRSSYLITSPLARTMGTYKQTNKKHPYRNRPPCVRQRRQV